MRRKTLKASNVSTHNAHPSKEFDAVRSIRALEERVRQLESDLGHLRGSTDLAHIPSLAPARKSPGPKPVNVWMVLSDRDNLVQMLEYYWPEIEPLCVPAPDAKMLSRVFDSISKLEPRRYEHHARHLHKYVAEVCDFLLTNRFRSDPRQIANAFAGFPAVGIWRSLKICQASPCNDPIGSRALRAYIRRRHPRLYERLSADYSTPNFAVAMKKYRTKDQKIIGCGGAFSLYIWWKQSVPDYESLKLNPDDFPSEISPRALSSRRE
jgi:hypothetical protein